MEKRPSLLCCEVDFLKDFSIVIIYEYCSILYVCHDSYFLSHPFLSVILSSGLAREQSSCCIGKYTLTKCLYSRFLIKHFVHTVSVISIEIKPALRELGLYTTCDIITSLMPGKNKFCLLYTSRLCHLVAISLGKSEICTCTPLIAPVFIIPRLELNLL